MSHDNGGFSVVTPESEAERDAMKNHLELGQCQEVGVRQPRRALDHGEGVLALIAIEWAPSSVGISVRDARLTPKWPLESSAFLST